MSNIDTINVGGLDYGIEDSTARADATSAMTISAYVENGNTASRAYPTIGTPINWKGTLYYTKASIASGATLSTSNLTAATNLGLYLHNEIKTVDTKTNTIRVYVGTDGKIHFTNSAGADSALNFNSGLTGTYQIAASVSTPGVDLGTSGTANVWRSGSASLNIMVSITKNGVSVSSGSLAGSAYAAWGGGSPGGGNVSYSTSSFSVTKIS